jgi:hypothetical protein
MSRRQDGSDDDHGEDGGYDASSPSRCVFGALVCLCLGHSDDARLMLMRDGTGRDGTSKSLTRGFVWYI